MRTKTKYQLPFQSLGFRGFVLSLLLFVFFSPGAQVASAYQQMPPLQSLETSPADAPDWQLDKVMDFNSLLTTAAIFTGAGDIASCFNNNDEHTAELLDKISGTVFTLGDNAYDSGTYTEYMNCYNPTWGREKSRTKPVPGNHEYYSSTTAAGYFQYFNNIPKYYAYNLGNWRIYALNSEINISATSAEVTWLKNDLATNPHFCVLAYWHEPRWSSGTRHGDGTQVQVLWQILANAKAELVLSGHEHNYERFTQMDANGKPVTQGLREIVVGTGGVGHHDFPGTFLSTSQVHNATTYGVLKLTLNTGRYDWKFIPVAGSTFTDSGGSSCH